MRAVLLDTTRYRLPALDEFPHLVPSLFPPLLHSSTSALPAAPTTPSSSPDNTEGKMKCVQVLDGGFVAGAEGRRGIGRPILARRGGALGLGFSRSLSAHLDCCLRCIEFESGRKEGGSCSSPPDLLLHFSRTFIAMEEETRVAAHSHRPPPASIAASEPLLVPPRPPSSSSPDRPPSSATPRLDAAVCRGG